MRMNLRFIPLLLLLLFVTTCSTKKKDAIALVGATLIDGTGKAPIKDAVIIFEKGKITAIGTQSTITIPDNASQIKVAGKTIMPGIINAHGHIGGSEGLSAVYSAANVARDLKLNAAYGITTVYSLGGDGKESVAIRDEQDTILLNRSRLYVAGEVITGSTPEEARANVDKNAAMNVDYIKIRVDDNLGTAEKMKPEIYQAIIEQASKHNLQVVAHIFYLEDANALLRSGVKFIGHSVRDQKVDEEFIRLMKENDAVYCPTLMREVSTFVYEDTPEFFQDPFFLKHADTAVIQQLKDPVRKQLVRTSLATNIYKGAFFVAKYNLKLLSDAGVRIAMGTDAGPPGRFQGYFEHLELEQMVDAGLTPLQAITAATGHAVYNKQQSQLGTLEVGKAADLLILGADPLQHIQNTRTIESVWIGGHKIP